MRHVTHARLRLLALVGVAVWLVVSAAPAHAKGAVAVTVSGPGITGARLIYTEPGGDVDLDTLTEAASFYLLVFGSDEGTPSLAEVPPPGDLGPRYVLTFDLGGSSVVEYAYPFADRGPYVEMPAGQQVYEIPVAPGWFAAGAPLRRALVTLGAAVPPPPPPAPVASPTTSPMASAAPVLLAVGAALAVAVGWVLVRRGRRAATTPAAP